MCLLTKQFHEVQIYILPLMKDTIIFHNCTVLDGNRYRPIPTIKLVVSGKFTCQLFVHTQFMQTASYYNLPYLLREQREAKLIFWCSSQISSSCSETLTTAPLVSDLSSNHLYAGVHIFLCDCVVCKDLWRLIGLRVAFVN